MRNKTSGVKLWVRRFRRALAAACRRRGLRRLARWVRPVQPRVRIWDADWNCRGDSDRAPIKWGTTEQAGDTGKEREQ